MSLAARQFEAIGLVSLAIGAALVSLLLPLEFLIGILIFISLGLAFLAEPTLALVATLCLAPLKTLIETESNLDLPIDIGQMLFGIFVFVWYIQQMSLDGLKSIKGEPTLSVALIGFILIASLSAYNAYSMAAFITEIIKWGQIFVLVLIIPNTSRLEWIVGGVLLSGVLQAVIGIWQFQGGSGAPNLWILDFQNFRAFGTFGQPNPFGSFMALLLPLASGLTLATLLAAWQRKSWQLLSLSMVLGGIALILALGLFVSWSRGAWIGALGGLAAMLWVLPKKRWQGTAILLCGAVVAFGGIQLGILPASLVDRAVGFTEDFSGFQDVRGLTIDDDNFAVIERLAHWQSAIEMNKASPWLGVGFGNYEVAYSDFALINWQNPLGHAHNYYLNLLAETGIIGLSSYLVLWIVIFGVTWSFLNDNAMTQDWIMRGIGVGLFGAWTHITIHSILDKLYVNNMFLHIGSLIGILAWLHLQQKAQHE